MADGVAITAGSGTTIATDDIGGVQHQLVKLEWGPADTANQTDVASGKPLPVQLRDSDGTDVAMSTKLGALAAKWKAGAGVGLTWTSAVTSSVLNSIASGNAIISDTAIDNSTALDLYADFSFIGGSVTTVGTPFIGLYLYPLLDNGTGYGDGRFGTSAAGPPPVSYLAGTLGLPVGAQAITGMFQSPTKGPIVIPPGQFKIVIYNGAGVAFASSGNTVKYRTYNR